MSLGRLSPVLATKKKTAKLDQQKLANNWLVYEKKYILLVPILIFFKNLVSHKTKLPTRTERANNGDSPSVTGYAGVFGWVDVGLGGCGMVVRMGWCDEVWVRVLVCA